MLFFFIVGVSFGGGVGWFFWWTARREITRLEEQQLMLMQEKSIVLDFVHNMVEAIGEGVSRQELFERVVHAAILSTGALSACIFQRDGNELRGVAVEGLFPPHRPLPASTRNKITTRSKFIEQILKSEVFKVGEGLVGAAAESGNGILIREAMSDPRVVRHDDPALAVRSIIVVPIRFRERVLAVLAIVNPSDGGAFSETDFSLAVSLAEQAGLAIHNLDLMASQIEKSKLDADLSLANEIQTMLLPRSLPRIDVLDMATIYQPAQKVGGDLYDVFRIDRHRIGIAVADVSGKGIPASIIMAICQSNLRHFARGEPSPSKVMCDLNRVMVAEMRPDMFITMVYVVVDTKASTLTFARCGHELPIIIRAGDDLSSRRADFVQSDGMALGMVPEDIFDYAMQDRTVAFYPGDILTLYTDGVTEAVNADGVEFGNGRLADVVRTLRTRSAEEVVQGILERIRLFSGQAAQGDDFTVFVLKHL